MSYLLTAGSRGEEEEEEEEEESEIHMRVIGQVQLNLHVYTSICLTNFYTSLDPCGVYPFTELEWNSGMTTAPPQKNNNNDNNNNKQTKKPNYGPPKN